MADSPLSPVLTETCWWITSAGAERRAVRRFDRAGALSLSAVFVEDERKSHLGLLTGARCQVPSGEVVEVLHRKTPFFSLCRELDALGYGDHRIEICTPAGTPSMRAAVRVAAGLIVTERDREGLRLEKYRPFPSRGLFQGRDEAVEAIRAPGTAPSRRTDSLARAGTRP